MSVLGSLSFASPLGLLALAGIPAVLWIHLLQVRSRRARISTLFLLEPRAFEREGGRKIERPRNSALLWLQLLAVLVATWLLVEPQWLREDSTVRAVLVVDGSASMTAFRNNLETALPGYLEELDRTAENVEWIVLGSDPTEKTLYSGRERDKALDAALEWRSHLGIHNLDESVALAASLAGPRGIITVLTDDEASVRPGVSVLAVGAPTDNVGFVSVSVENEREWRAILKNAGAARQSRSWRLDVDGVPGRPETIELDSSELHFLAGSIPEGARQLQLVLEDDAFGLDDRLPFVVPKPKALRVSVAPALAEEPFIAGLLDALEPVNRVGASEADLTLGVEGPRASIVFAASAPGGDYAAAPIVTESHPLVEGLDFRGLIARNAEALAPASGQDRRVLVWQGEHPLLAVERRGASRVLSVGFPLEGSNADRVPAFVLALHRFAESVREDKRGYAKANVETRERLHIAKGVYERAPAAPGFFEVRRGDETLFEGAAYFADIREGDLTGARSVVPDGSVVQNAVVTNSLPDPLAPVWLLLLMAVAAVAWTFQGKGA